MDDDVDAERPQGPRVDVVVTDYEHAMHLANAAVAAARRPLAASRILVRHVRSTARRTSDVRSKRVSTESCYWGARCTISSKA